MDWFKRLITPALNPETSVTARLFSGMEYGFDTWPKTIEETNSEQIKKRQRIGCALISDVKIYQFKYIVYSLDDCFPIQS